MDNKIFSEKSAHLSEDELRQLDAKHVKLWEVPKEATFLGTLWLPYGDMNYYRLPDGSYVCVYYSIGD